MATQHTHGPNFGRKVEGCSRCAELTAGAAPIQGWGLSRLDRAREDERRIQDIRNHNCHTAGCGVVCTAFDW